MQPWWRFRRGLTLGVRGIVLTIDEKLLLVRQSYAKGWHLPGGGVERGETLGRALARELSEEANIELDSPPRLHGVFSNGDAFPGDHVAVFLATDWRQTEPKKPDAEIRAAEFFHKDALPQGTTPGTRRRLAEILDGAAVSEHW